jgi:hypothetical protein
MLHSMRPRYGVWPFHLLCEGSDDRQSTFDSQASHFRSWFPRGTLLPWTPHTPHPASLNSCGRARHQSAELRRRLGRSDTPPVTIHTMANATARGNASARALWNRRSIRRSANDSAHASRWSEPYAGRVSSGGSARACGIAIGRRHSGSGIQGSVPPRSQWRLPPELNALLCRQSRGMPLLRGWMSTGQALGPHQESGWRVEIGDMWQGRG